MSSFGQILLSFHGMKLRLLAHVHLKVLWELMPDPSNCVSCHATCDFWTEDQIPVMPFLLASEGGIWDHVPSTESQVLGWDQQSADYWLLDFIRASLRLMSADCQPFLDNPGEPDMGLSSQC